MSSSIAEQVDHFNTGFTAQIGPELSAVFAREQQDLTRQGLPQGAVAEGDTVPDAALTAVDGSPVELSEVLAEAAAVVVFYRGAWCPYCNITLKTYQRDLLPTLTEHGIQLIAISPQTPDGSRAAVENGELGFTVLSDPGSRLARQLGLLTEPSPDAREAHSELGFDVADSNADSTAGIPFPTVLLVDQVGTVRFADVHADYTRRTEVPQIIEALDRFSKG
ncbi:peroxiredoxin-like family protein [Arthrobacter sp. HLT1-21]